MPNRAQLTWNLPVVPIIGILMTASMLSAAEPGYSDNCTMPGIINETNFNGFPKDVTVHLTDKDMGGNEVIGGGFPVGPTTVPAHTTVGVPVPAAPPGVSRCDAINTWASDVTAGGGGRSPIGPPSDRVPKHLCELKVSILTPSRINMSLRAFSISSVTRWAMEYL